MVDHCVRPRFAPARLPGWHHESSDHSSPKGTPPLFALRPIAITVALGISCIVVMLVVTGCTPPPGEKSGATAIFADFVDAHFSGETDGGESPPFRWLTPSGDSLRFSRARASLAGLRAIDTSALDLDMRIDWLLLEATLRRTLMDSVLRNAERIPGRYLTLGSIEWSVGGARPPDEETWRSVLRTLSEAPMAMEIGKRRLVDPPKLWVDLSLGTIGRYDAYLVGPFREVVGEKAPVAMRDSLHDAAEKAMRALRDFRSFLQDSVAAGGEGSWAVGREYYDWVLREYHFLPYDVDAMIDAGWREHTRTKEALRALAASSGTGRSWQELVREMKEHHPDPNRITDAYAQESDRARELIESSRMIEIPPAESLIFVPTPPALRETYAWGGYGGITMRDSVMTGRFFVTDVDAGMTEDEVSEKLRTQNTGWINVIALHEGYPGHHLQSVYSRLNPQKVRARYGSTYFGEGWALYCESWMGRNGFYVDRWDSLGWLNMRLWRTARVILDPSLHAGLMNYEDAVTFFMDEVGLERSAAAAEVNRYTTWPTQAPSYIIGWLEIERLKTSLQRQYGSELTERAFAEAMLRAGSLPPSLLERAMQGYWAVHSSGSSSLDRSNLQ